MSNPAPQNPIPSRLFLTPKDLFPFYGDIIKTQRGVQRRYRAIADSLKKKPGQRITLKEFAEAEGIPYADVVEVINRK